MKARFITKRDASGNRYTITVNTDTRTYKQDYNPLFADDYIQITKLGYKTTIEQLQRAGYTEII